MVAFNFNANDYQPSYGGGDGGLPDGLYNTVISNTAKVDKADSFGNVTSSYLEITHTVIDGPLKGQTMKDRLTLLHASAEVVRIANTQLSAYCHVLQAFQWTDTSVLHNKPMKIEVGRQIDKTTKAPTAYGEIKKIFDVNGKEPGKAGQSGPTGYQQQQHSQPQGGPAGGVQADGAGWNGGQNGGQQGGGAGGGGFQGGQQGGGAGGQGQGGGFQGGNGGGGQDQGGQGGNWGGQGGGAQGGQQGGQGGAGGGFAGGAGGQDQGGQGGGFGGAQGGQQGGQGGGWSQGGGGGQQGGGAAGGAPNWGAR